MPTAQDFRLQVKNWLGTCLVESIRLMPECLSNVLRNSFLVFLRTALTGRITNA